MVCLSLLYEVNGANSGVACRVLLFRSGVHTTFAAPGKSRRRHQDQCKHQCKDAVVCHHTTGELLKYLHLSFLSNLSTRSSVRGRLAARESVSNNGGKSLSRRVGAGAGPSCKMGVCDVDTISDIDFSFAAWVYYRLAQWEFPVDCGMLPGAKWIEPPQRVERIDRNRL